MKKLPLILALALLLASSAFAEKKDKDKKIGSSNKGCRVVCENGVLNAYNKEGDLVLECKKKDFDNQEQIDQAKKIYETCGGGKYAKLNKEHKNKKHKADKKK